MKWNTLLAATGYKSAGGGKYFDPLTDRKISRATALNRAAQFYGYKSYDVAKEAYKSKAYSRIVEGGYKSKGETKPSFAKQAGVANDYRLQKLFADTWKARNKKKSTELTKLLKYVGKVNKHRTAAYGPPL